MAENHFHARQAAIALLKMAKATSDPMVAAGLVEAAADLKEQTGELPGDVRTKGLSAHERYRAQRRAAEPRSILLVEDEESLRACLRMMLELEGHQITEASNGAEAQRSSIPVESMSSVQQHRGLRKKRGNFIGEFEASN